MKKSICEDSNVCEDVVNSDSDSDVSNLCENFTENDYIGKKFREQKNSDEKRTIFRVQGCNPNGFRLGIDGGDFSEFCTDMAESCIDVSCVSEINIDTTNFKAKNIIYDTARCHFDNKVKVNLASSSIISKTFYKPGGVLMITAGNASGRVIKKGSDSLGRWTYQYFACKDSKCLVIITAYQPCKQSLYSNGKIQSNTVTAQQTSMLLSNDDSRSPRKAFVEDLDQFVQLLKNEGNRVMIVGDFNEALYEQNSGIQRVMVNNNLCDVMWKALRNDSFSTHLTGSKRIDYVLADHEVYECIINVCYEPFKLRNKGDHCTMVLDFDTDALFGNPTYQIHSPLHR